MSLCRLSIHVDDGDATTVDVALPSGVAVAELLPTVVDLAGRAPAAQGVRWRLADLAGTPVDDTATLRDNAIRDGDVLVLTVDAPLPVLPRSWDPPRAVAAAAPDVTRPPSGWGGTATMVVAAVAVVAAGMPAQGRWVALLAAALAACAVTARAVAQGGVPSGCAAAALGAATGALAVPAGLAPPNVLLGATVAAVLAVLLIRRHGARAAWVAVAACASLVAVAAGVGTAWPLPTATLGALLAVTALVTLGAAARLAAAITGLHAGRMEADVGRAAIRAHGVLDGLVAGSAVAVTGGGATVAIASHGTGSAAAGVAFVAVLAVAVGVRRRVHADHGRRTALVVAAYCCAATALAAAVIGWPDDAAYVAAAALVVAVALASVGGTAGAVGHRALDVVEWGALAAVLPTACWVCGVYAAARGWHPS